MTRRSQPELLVVDDPLFDAHAPRGYHPERPERLSAARRAVEGVRDRGAELRPIAPRDATDAELARVHDEGYLAELGRLDGHYAALDADTYVAPKSIQAARRAAGGAIALVDALLDAPPAAARGVALLRPPGHHATRAQGMGFCLLNNAAVAAAHASSRGVPRVAIVDWDVHHGNGTQDIFYEDGQVLYLSLHQFPLYPGTGRVGETGAGEGLGATVNVPLSPGAGPATYAEAFERLVVPVLERFAPELIIISAGFDAHERDPLASMRLTDAAYGAMTRSLAAIADGASGRLALLLEGGYDLTAIRGALGASLDAALGLDPAEASAASRPPPPVEPTSTRHTAEIAEARKVASDRWRI